jgi:hypothetical protein
MWLMKIDRMPGPSHADRLHFECKVCDGRATVPPLT